MADQTLQKINQFITLGHDTAPYLSAEKIIRYITKEMKRNVAFSYIYRGEQIAGSYADDLKISAPDEFDFLLRLNFPCASQMTVTKTEPGYIELRNCSIQKIQPNNAAVFEILLRLFDNEGYLLKSKVLSWFEELLMIFLRTLPKGPKMNEYVLQIDQKYVISRSRSGPAHTINVCSNGTKFSIDMVVALVLNDRHWVSTRIIDPNLCNGKWHAVPKPNGNDRNWISSYAEIERFFIKDKLHLKGLIRYFKKLRDLHNLTNFKSYYIKTIFLWQIIERPSTYWSKKSLEFLFFEMFDVIIKHFERGELFFFWDKDYNMFSTLKKEQLQDIHRKLKSLYSKSAVNSSEKVLDILLTPVERSLYRSGSAGRQQVEQPQPANISVPPQAQIPVESSGSRCEIM